MKPFPALPTSLVALNLLSQALAVEDARPTAIRSLPQTQTTRSSPTTSPSRRSQLSYPRDDAVFFAERDDAANASTRFLPPYARHFNDADYNLLRRAAEALALLQRRDSCPSGTNSCSNVNHPNKCCQEGTYCVSVEDDTVGGVACCPDGASCDGVGSCPSGATSCSEELGGGCCISGYCARALVVSFLYGSIPLHAIADHASEGVPSASATRSSTSTRTSTSQSTSTTTTAAATTTTTTSSTEAESTTEEETTTADETTATQETTQTSTASGSETTATQTITGTATGGAPLRPISSDTTDSTQTGCPTNYYGCLATHGGGCCRTDRECNTYDCPASSTTVVSDGATIVVVATDAPPAADATSTCDSDWFLCGTAAGSVAGCCPTGYSCGTASCFTVTASHTESVQKQFPDNEDLAAARDIPRAALGTLVAAVCLLLGL